MAEGVKRTRELRLPIRDKKNVDPTSWRLKSCDKGVKLLQGRERGSTLYETYSYRFDPKLFTLSTARKYLQENKIQELRRFEDHLKSSLSSSD
jgi:hypothetical protein